MLPAAEGRTNGDSAAELSLAQATGMSQTAVCRIWEAFGLKPHLTESFKLSPDPQAIDKVRDIVGLYLNPPDAAVVLCVDEESQIQALDRTASILPLLPGVPARATHDYRRFGTTNLYAALDLASGRVIADPTLADAILDRLVHGAHKFTLSGESMRKKKGGAPGRDTAKDATL